MRRHLILVTLPLSMMVTMLALAPLPARTEEAVPSAFAQALRDATPPAEQAALASSYDRAATAAYAKAAAYRNLALNQQRLALTGRSQFLSNGHYFQLEQYYKRLAAEYTASAATQRQRAQAPAQTPQ
jgi:hypothetical protein